MRRGRGRVTRAGRRPHWRQRGSWAAQVQAANAHDGVACVRSAARESERHVNQISAGRSAGWEHGQAGRPAAAALLSSISNLALGAHDVYFGEISLSGAVRPAGHMMSRLKEAQKLGFKRAAVAVARKLAVIVHAMLKSGEPFNRTAA